MNKWIAEFDLEEGDTMPEHMDLNYMGAHIDFNCRPMWIPVSERLPEICEKDCHGDITFSKTVISTRIYGNGYVYVGIDNYTTNNGGGWLSEVPFDNPDECCKVLAWMPLPEPYKESEG